MSNWKILLAAGAIASVVAIGCDKGPGRTDQHMIPFFQVKGDDTLMKGSMVDGWPSGEWQASFSEVRKKGRYDRGLLTGRWTYLFGDTTLSYDWVNLKDSSSGLFFSVPNSFRIDTSSAPGSVRFIRPGGECPTLFAIVVDTTGGHRSFDDIIKEEVHSAYGDYRLLGNECSVVHLNDRDVRILDLRSALSAPNGDTLYVNFMNRTIGSASMSLIFFSCRNNIENNGLFGEMAQSLIYRSEYFFSPIMSVSSVTPCGQGL